MQRQAALRGPRARLHIDGIARLHAGGDLYIHAVTEAGFHRHLRIAARAVVHQHAGRAVLVKGECRHGQHVHARDALAGDGHGGLHAGEHILRSVDVGGYRVTRHRARGSGDAVHMVDLRLKGQPQGNHRHLAPLAGRDGAHVVFVHAGGHAQIAQIRDGDKRHLRPDRVAPCHVERRHRAVDGGGERLAVGKAQKFVAGGNRLIGLHIDLLHGGALRGGERFRIYQFDRAAQTHRSFDIARLHGILRVDRRRFGHDQRPQRVPSYRAEGRQSCQRRQTDKPFFAISLCHIAPPWPLF